MANYKIGEFEFAIWRRDPPQFVGEQVSTHTRAGSDGVGHQLLGAWGRPFEAELHLWVGGSTRLQNFLTAKRLLPYLQALRTLGPQRVFYENIDYEFYFQHRYTVIDVQELSCQSHTQLVGPTFSYSNGAALVVLMRMVPQVYFPPPEEEEEA